MGKIYLINQEIADKLIGEWDPVSSMAKDILMTARKKLLELKGKIKEVDENGLVNSHLQKIESNLCMGRRMLGRYGRTLKPTLEHLKKNPGELLITIESFNNLIKMNAEAINLYKGYTELVTEYRSAIQLYDMNHCIYRAYNLVDILENQKIV